MVALVVTLGLTVGNAPKRAVTEPGAMPHDNNATVTPGRSFVASVVPGSLTVAVKEPVTESVRNASGGQARRVGTGSLTATSLGLYRSRTAAYWAARFRHRTRQLQAALGRIKHLKRRLRQRHTSAAASTATSSTSYGVWDRLADCESGGDWAANTGNGFYGGLQWTLSTWSANGGQGMPNLASRKQQIAVAERTLAVAHGRFTDWPGCRKKLGLP